MMQLNFHCSVDPLRHRYFRGYIGTGTSALVLQGSHYRLLKLAIDRDVQRLEKSMSALEKSLSSLAEVVLQTRRGLDLLFLQQGRLCIALGERCVCAEQTGIVRQIW